MNKPILCLDFDGVIHSYTSGWKGATIIPDDPVPGALEFIVNMQKTFTVAILSSRSHQFGGRRAMKKWLLKHYLNLAVMYDTTPDWLLKEIHTFSDPWPDQVDWDMKRIVNTVKWPLFKPPAMVTIDDRAVTFKGKWPTESDIHGFKPWYK